MENPLTKEQLEKLNSIAKLPLEQQKQELQSFLKTLTKEQYEFLLRAQSSGSCLFCDIVAGKLPSRKIYEDAAMIAVLDIKPAAPGHVLLFPKKHVPLLTQLSDIEVQQLFLLATKLSARVFEVTKAHGTNIFVASGAAAGQHMSHALIHIIPRFEKDPVQFQWEGVTVSDEDLAKIEQALKGSVKLVQEPKVVKQTTVSVSPTNNEFSFEQRRP